LEKLFWGNNFLEFEKMGEGTKGKGAKIGIVLE